MAASCSRRSCGIIVLIAMVTAGFYFSTRELPTVFAMDSGILPTKTECWWNFVEYHPSEYEELWLKDIEINQEQVCKRSKEEYGKYHDIYVEAITKLIPDSVTSIGASGGECPDLEAESVDSAHYRADADLDPSVFSTMEYKWMCDTDSPSPENLSRLVFIEPLAGVLRHPQVCENFDKFLVRRDYLVISGWAMHNAYVQQPALSHKRPPRNFYFDLGASLWDSGNGSSSQNWLHAAYKSLCKNFDHIYAWEAKSRTAVEVMRVIPADVKSKYHWFNVPADPVEGAPDNPMRFILSETLPHDFVLLKIDIDNWLVEEAFVRQILGSRELQTRIDEMFWEHHVNFEPMATVWHTEAHREFKMIDSLKLFNQFRKLGIRIHSWV